MTLKPDPTKGTVENSTTRRITVVRETTRKAATSQAAGMMMMIPMDAVGLLIARTLDTAVAATRSNPSIRDLVPIPLTAEATLPVVV